MADTKEIKPIKTQKKEHKIPKKAGVEIGKVGTDIFSGYIDVDYHSKWKDQITRVETVQKMVDGDATVAQVLDAMKGPILSAKPFIEPSGNKEMDDFAKQAMFEEIDHSQFMNESLTCLEHGYSIFEKVFKIKDGKIFWKKLAFREQSSLETWSIDGEPWRDGHPAGITQQINGTDDLKTSDASVSPTLAPEIPWEKLMLFSWEKKGNNFEGKSVLRSAYKHWFYKDLMEKIGGIYGERFGAGIPTMRYKKGTSKKLITEFKKMVKNIKTNEQAYGVFEDGNTLEIITPQGATIQNFIVDFIKYQDKKIYDRVNAGFLNLASGDGGSNALAQDLSSFFLRSLQKLVMFHCSIVNNHLRELLWLNFETKDNIPKYCISDVGDISLDELISSLSTAKQSGLVTWTSNDEMVLREKMKLSPMTEEEIDKAKADQPAPPPIKNPKKDENIIMEKKNLNLSEQSGDDDLRKTERERVFTRNIIDYENYLSSEKKNYNDIITAFEAKYQKGIKIIYGTADLEIIDGRKVFADTKRNKELMKKGFKFVDDVTERLDKKLIDSPIQRRLFDRTKKKAVKALLDDERLLKEKIKVDEGKFRSFVAGYVSNVKGVLFNEPRRMKENIEINFGGQVSLDLAVKQAGEIKFNRNIFNLSTISHARGSYNSIQFDNNSDSGFTFYKVLVPTQKIKGLKPQGLTSKLLYRVFTIAELNQAVSKATKGKTTDVVNGLNLHHGAFTFYFAILAEQLAEEKRIAKKQRSEFIEAQKKKAAKEDEE